MKKLIPILLILFLSIIFLSGCTNENVTNNEEVVTETEDIDEIYENPKVFASFYPIYDFVRNIGGERVNLELIIPAGADPHHFEISARGLSEMESADLIFLIGLEFEPWENDLRNISKGSVVSLGEHARPLPFRDDHHHSHDHDHHHGLIDPHVWMDPTRAIDMSEVILEYLINIAPDNEDYYKANFEIFRAKLEELDKSYSQLREINNKKPVVVSHNSYGYISDTYGVEFYSISGISSEQEPSLRVLAEIVELVRTKNIDVIFFEELANEKVAKTIADETGARTDILYTIEGMTPDEIASGMDYISKMTENLNKLLEAVK